MHQNIFKLRIITLNSAFDESVNDEIARILRDVADKVESGRTDGKCMDENGNIVGRFSL